MTLRLRIGRIEERLEHIGAGRPMQTICFLCDSGVATTSQADAALADYQANHPGWEAEAIIEVRVNAGVSREHSFDCLTARDPGNDRPSSRPADQTQT